MFSDTPTHEMIQTVRRSAAKVGILAILFIIPGQMEAQPLGTSISGWFGGVYDRFEENFPFSPQVGGRLEVTPLPYVWLGGEVMTRFDKHLLICPDGAELGCEPFTSRSSTTIASAHVRFELANLEAKPYALGMIGKVHRDGWTETVTGVGLGIRLPVGFVANGVSMEVRYREDEPSYRSHSHWEFMFGVALL